MTNVALVEQQLGVQDVLSGLIRDISLLYLSTPNHPNATSDSTDDTAPKKEILW